MSSSKSSCDADDYWLLIVDGYIRKENTTFELIIPNDINKLICVFYQLISRYFDKYNHKLFKASDENRVMSPIGPANHSCDNYMIFPSPNGYSNGIHKWAVKFAGSIESFFARLAYRSIGVTTKIHDKWITNGVGVKSWCNDVGGSYWNGRMDWNEYDIVQVTLNLNTSTVTYHKYHEIPGDDKDQYLEVKKLKEDELKPGQIYYFAFCMDCDRRCCVVECVEPKL